MYNCLPVRVRAQMTRRFLSCSKQASGTWTTLECSRKKGRPGRTGRRGRVTQGRQREGTHCEWLAAAAVWVFSHSSVVGLDCWSLCAFTSCCLWYCSYSLYQFISCSLLLVSCRSAAKLFLPAFECYPCGVKQCCHLKDTG